MSLNLDPFKPANGERPISAAKMRNSYDAIVSHTNALPPQNISGFPADGSLYLDGAGGWTAPGTGVFHTSLPGGAVDGQVLVYRADDTNDIFWQLKYRESTGHWLKIGGPPLYAAVDTSQATSSTSFADLATVGPSLVLPLAAVGYARFGVEVLNNSTSSTNTVGLYLGVAPTADNIIEFCGGSGFRLASIATERKVTGTVGMVLKLQYKTDGASQSFARRFLAFDPIYVT